MTRRLIPHPAFLALFLMCAALMSAAASVKAATSDWLLAQRQATGAINAPADSVIPEIATVEAWRALAESGADPALLSATVAYAAALVEPSSELGARRLLATRAAGLPVDADMTLLRSHTAQAGGSGYLAGFEPDVASTAWVLEAFSPPADVDMARVAAALGWLQARQRGDGGWALGANNSSNVYLTAVALRAAWHYRHRFNLTNLLTRASNFLVSARNGNGLWADDVDSAVALLALVPLQNPPDALAPSVAALAAHQDAAGSLGGDVFATALWLRLQRLAAAPDSNPDLGSLRLRVLDAETSRPITNVPVVFSGPMNVNGLTDSGGRFEALHLVPGQYAVSIDQDAYQPLSVYATLPPGEAVDLGDQALVADTVQATTGAVRGAITHAESGQPLQAVRVTVRDVVVFSDAAGEFEVRGLAPGAAPVSAELAGFHTVFGDGAITAGGTVLFNAALVPVAGGGTPVALVEGRVTDKDTGAALSDAQVSVTGATSASATTDADGRYRITPLGAGPTTFAVSHNGHVDVSVTAEVHNGERIEFSPALARTLGTPADTGTRVGGQLIDAVTQRPIVGAHVRIDDGRAVHESVSDGAGSFLVRGVATGYATLKVERHEYVEVGFGLAIPPVEEIGAGQIRMRPLNAPQIRPDLRVQEVSAEAVSSGIDELTATGTLRVRIDNRFGAPLDREVEILAFVDHDADRIYDPAVDAVLGRVRQHLTLAASNDPIDVNVNVSGRLPFRDAPIAALIDPADEVAELSEDNNFGISAGRCRAVVPAMDEGRIVEAMRWQGDPSLPADVRMSSATVAVAQLTDDNNDGHIDHRDTPDLVVPVGRGTETGSWGVVALSGDDLHLLWKFNQFRISQFTAPAVGDIDGDDKVEIALVDARRTTLVVLENDGTLKWSAPTGPFLPCSIVYCPPDAGDAILMANLVADQRPEIVVNKQVYDAQGQLVWTGAYSGAEYSVLGAHPIAADLDVDGHNELLGGRTVYRGDGSVLWHRDDLPENGHSAVGNFDADPQPEIVFVSVGRVYLLDHNGATMWGPVLLPGGYGGGPPTVADYDGDGLAEIGVMSANAFSVIDGDGTVLWSAAADDPLAIHSAAVFDFEADGRLEVVFHDHNDLHIVDAVTGAERVRVHNTHLTAFENPVIADLDHDGEAEIILSSTDDWQAQTTGLRVFKADNGPWAGAGDIWNQYDFHIDNVDRNGVVAAVEPPYWLSHNSNRKNTLNDRDPIGRADFAIGAPQVVDNGAGQTPMVRVRVGNAGQPTSAEQVRVALYAGNPASGGTLLATSEPASVLPGRWRTFDLPLSTPPGSGELHVMVDPDGRYAECNEGNNVAHGPYLAAQPRLSLSLDSDASAYDPGSAASLHASLSNDGATPTRVRVQMWVETLYGEGVVSLPESTATTLAAQQTLQHDATWSIGAVQAGRYVVRARAVPDGGLPAAEASREIEVRAIPGGDPAVSLRVSTTRSEYPDRAEVKMEAVIANRSTNLALGALALDLEIRDPGGLPIHVEQQFLPQLAPGMSEIRRSRINLVDVPAGEYLLRGTLRDLAANAVVVTDTYTFRVVDTPIAALSGRVEHDHAVIAPGDAQECRMHFDNAGSEALSGLPVRLALLRLADPPGYVSGEERSINVPPSGSVTEIFVPATALLAGGEYACASQVQRNGEWTSLAFRAFVVQARADLAASVASAPADARLGASFELGFDVANTGPSDASAVAVNVSLPSRLAFITAVEPAGVVCTTAVGTVRCEVGNLALGASRRLVLTLRGLSSGPATVTATVSAAEQDDVVANNAASATIAIRPQVNLSILGQSCRRPTLSGGVGRISVRAGNAGPDSASDVVLGVTPPVGARILDYVSDHGSCAIDTSGLHCGLGPMPVGDAARVSFAFSTTSQVLGPTAWPTVIGAAQDEGDPVDNLVTIWRDVIGDLLFYDGFDDCALADDVIWVNGFE